jgi:hypothetical protein
MVRDLLGKHYYKGSKIYAKPHDNNEYIIVEHVSSAPLIVTGRAHDTFTPGTLNGISVYVDHAYSTECIAGSTLISNVQNPMGYGARQDDFVTMYRICDDYDEFNSDCPGGKYVIIGTGNTPSQTTTEGCMDE